MIDRMDDDWRRDLPDALLRPAHEHCWTRLTAIFQEIAEVDDEPDPSLRRWEQLRRCPWAVRQVWGAHPLGLPTDHRIPQVVLASAVFKNTKRGATEWFHDPEALLATCSTEQARRRPKTFIDQDFHVEAQELELFEEQAEETFRQLIGAEYPKFARYEVNSRGFRCYFYNGLADRNPSSFCDGDRSRILLCGQHDFGTDGVPLAATPNQIFEWLVSRHEADNGTSPVATDDLIIRRYKAVVNDRGSLATFLNDHIVEMIVPHIPDGRPAASPASTEFQTRPDTHVLIRGPQGCGKSTVTMQKLPAIYGLDPGVVFFSSPSIRQAEEKVETFLRVNQDDRFVPYLYLSLTALYERFCPAGNRIDHMRTLEQGETSWLRVIYERQREVYEAMYAYRCRLFDLRDQGKVPILFGTHETLRQHAKCGMTRMFYAQDFGDNWFATMPMDERERRRCHLLAQNRIHRAVVDEVTAADLVNVHTAEIVEWVRRCAEEIGFEHIEGITERYKKFVTFQTDHPCTGMTWNLLLDVLACDYQDEHLVDVSGGEVPFDETNLDGIYASLVGRRYYVRPRGWWNEFWRVTMLTTEAVPTRIIEAIDKESASRGEQQDDRCKVYSLDLPDSSRDVVTIELQRACRKETLPALVRAYRERYSEAQIITDMVKSRIEEFAVNTHMSAKGSNAYVGSDVIAFYTNPSPALFGQLGALNAKFNRADMVRLFYIDQFDQTTGRNRGYRGQSGRSHTAVFPPRLHSWLGPAITSAGYVGVMAKPSVTFGGDGEISNIGESSWLPVSSARADDGLQKISPVA